MIAVGLFVLVLGGALKYWAYDRIAVLPLDFYARIDMTGRATYLDLQTLTEKTSEARVVQTFRGDVDESTDEVLLVDVSAVVSATSGDFIGATIERAAVDRHTGEFVNCCGETVEGAPAEHHGYAFKFPFNTSKREHPLWDNTDLRSYPGRYQGESTIAGHRVYKFVSTSEPHEVRRLPEVGALVGDDPGASVAVYNRATRTYWVEPVTGLPLAASVDLTTTLRNARGEDKVTLFTGSISTDPENPDPDTLALVNREIGRIRLLNTAPPILLVTGAMLALLGVLFLRRGRARSVGG